MSSLRQPTFRWGRLVAWTGGALALLAFLAYFGASLWLNHYLHSEAFRALLNQKTSAFFAADGEYAPIQCAGFSFYSDRYAAKGRAGAPMKELQADQVRADFVPAAIFEGAWRVSNLQIQRVNLALASGSAATVELTSPCTVSAAGQPRGSSWIPEHFELQRTQVQETNIAWTPAGRPGSLQQMRLVLEPDGHDLIATGCGGRLQQTGWPVMTVDHVKLRCRYPEVFLTDSLFQLSSSETLNVSGQADLGPSRTVDLLVKFNGIIISPYLPEDWRAGVKGNANGEARVTGTLGSSDGIQAAGTLNLTNAQLEALPILQNIASFTRTRQFRQFALQKAEAEFLWTPAKLTVSRLIAESEGLIRMEGGFSMEQGTLQGEFQLGVTPSSLRWLPGSRKHVFTQEHDGYAWTTLKVSGPPEHLNEDLSERLTAAAGEEVIQGIKDAKGTLEQGAKSLFDMLKGL